MKKGKLFAGLIMAGVLCATSVVPGFAAIVEENSPKTSVQQSISFTKTQEEIVPLYTVDIPATVELGKNSTSLTYSMNLQNHEEFVPDGKKVSVKIQSAGYPTALNRFALWNKKNFTEATYKVYDSDAASKPTYYEIGDEIASWEGSNWGTVTRKAKLDDYYGLGAGSYTGVINYTIALEDK